MSDNNEKLGIKEKIAYGLGDVSNGLAVSSISLWLLIYLTDVAGLSPQVAALAIVIGRVWDAVTDPVMGWITDHTKSRWGKRRPYLLFGAIPYALAYFSLWVVPGFEKEVFSFAYVTVALVVFNTCLTVVFVPYTSLTAAITNDYNERTSITGYRMFCSQSSFLIGAAIPSALVMFFSSVDGSALLRDIGAYDLFGSWAGTARTGYFIMAIIFALIMIASIWTTFLGCRERDTEEEEPDPNQTPLTYASSILDELQGNRPFRLSVLILLLTNCATAFIAVNLAYYIQYVLKITSHQTNIVSFLFVVAIIMVPIWVSVAKKFGKVETYRVTMLCLVAVLCMLPFVKEGDVTFTYIVAGMAGLFYSAALLLPWAIVPDVVEFDQLKTGKRREGLFYGGTTFSYKLATAIAVFASGSILEWAGYIANQDQTTTVVATIQNIIGPLPALILVFSVYLSLYYPLTAEKHKKIVEEIAAKKL